MNPRIEPGDPVSVCLTGVAGAPRFRARVRESEGQLITLRCAEAPYRAGDVLRLEIVIPGDAHYNVDARLRAYRERVLILDPIGEWSRSQRREYYRVRTHPIPVHLIRDIEHRNDRDQKYKTFLYDLSGSGAQIETDLSLEEGERLVARFFLQPIRLDHLLALVDDDPDLPALEVEISALVMRVHKLSAGRKRRVGIRFSGVSPTMRQQMLRWIYAVQSQRRAQEVDNGF